MITEDYCSFEVSKLLKKKGFNERGLCVYAVEEERFYTFGDWVENSCLLPHLISAPTHQTAMKWLREVYGIDIAIEISDPLVKNRKYYCVVWDKNNDSYILDLFDSYEECVEAALKYTLENLI